MILIWLEGSKKKMKKIVYGESFFQRRFLQLFMFVLHSFEKGKFNEEVFG